MKKPITAVCMAVVLVLSVCGAAFCMAGHMSHDCTGAGCTVCAVIEQCEGLLRTAATAAAVILLLTASRGLSVLSAAPAVCEATAATPIQLKVKLLN